MESIFGISLGLGLSAACGFRVFVPLLILNLASASGHVELAQEVSWIGSNTALIAFCAATILEIGAYYIPWLDNLLDGVAGPVSVIAGIIVAGSCFTDMSPFLRWVLAVILGGGSAGAIQAGTTTLRLASSATSGGLANPVVATAEAGSAVGLSLLTLLIPILGAAVVIFVIAFAIIHVRRFVRKRREKQE